ncbi:MAG: CBS domain-containing protein [Dehalococcoidia bacterium]|nr:CBS domain-containing protein [Dehalococcoidia bacterium]
MAALKAKNAHRVSMDRSRLSRFVSQPLQELPLGEPVVVSPLTTVRAAVARMKEGSHSCVLAMEDDRLTGIFTERDVLTKCMEGSFDWDQPIGGSLLTARPRTIPATASVGEAVALMQQHHYRTLPVAQDGRITGLIRLGDLLTHLAEAYPEDVLNLPPRPHQVMERPEGG